MYLLGFDIGSSSIKAALVSAKTGEKIAVVQSPETEMDISAPQPGWAEQDPENWWQHVCLATKKLLQKTGIQPTNIAGIGISYQMHGLVLVDKNHQALRPAIIWCDSRAVEIGNRAFREIGEQRCLTHLLNSPGNFTASKLAWVKQNEPHVFERIHHFMLPGDYVAMRLTGEILTTPSGLSEGIFWDFQADEIAGFVLEHFGFDRKIVPPVTPTFSLQGNLTQAAAEATGLSAGIPVAYRAGDQPNNALSLNVLQPGEVAATGGTSGVVYAVLDKPAYDLQSRVNGFLHVNHALETLPTNHQSPITHHQSPVANHQTRIGVLLCINGAGITYNWLRQNVALDGMTYQDMELLAGSVAPGSEGLFILPFGNGAERMLANRNPGAQICRLDFNRHGRAHLYRAGLEGIAFSFVYGMDVLRQMGLNVSQMRVGNDNLFQSAIFSNTIAQLVGCQIEVVETTGAVGAAKAAGVATGIFGSVEEAMRGGEAVLNFEPKGAPDSLWQAYQDWRSVLHLTPDPSPSGEGRSGSALSRPPSPEGEGSGVRSKSFLPSRQTLPTKFS